VMATRYPLPVAVKRAFMRITMRQRKHNTSTAPTVQLSPPRRSDAGSFAALFPSEIETVIIYWLDGDNRSFERWDIASGTLLVNRRNKSIRFGVRTVGDTETEPFEVVICRTAAGWTFKADCLDEPDAEYPLQVFKGPHSILFVFNGKRDNVYIHVEMAG